jgi:hypothetical protein
VVAAEVLFKVAHFQYQMAQVLVLQLALAVVDVLLTLLDQTAATQYLAQLLH